MNFKPLADYIDRHLIEELGIPSVDVRVMQNHKELFRHKAGHSDRERTTPIVGGEIYDLYSCTKPMTCTSALQLVERGIVGLDDPVYKYLPEYKNAFVVKNGEKVTVGEKMTVRHLFMMAGGLDYDLKKPDMLELIEANPHAGTVEVVNSFARTPLCFEPGERFNYSLCHDVLAAVVEVASGMRFSEFLRENIWEPLGMKNISFGFENNGGSVQCARYVYEKGAVNYDPNPNCFALTDNFESGGAGISTCVEDYSLFADAMACGGVGASGNRILKAETIDLMRTEQLTKHLKDPAFIFDDYGYGLGVRTQLVKCNGSRSSVGEFGWDGAAGSYIVMDPETKLSIFMAMNVLYWPDLMNEREGHYAVRDLTYQAIGM